MTTFHPAQWVLTEYSRQCPGVFSSADTFRKTDPDSLSRGALKTYTPLGEIIALAAWRTGKTITRCYKALLVALVVGPGPSRRRDITRR